MCYWLPASITEKDIAVTGCVEIDEQGAQFVGQI